MRVHCDSALEPGCEREAEHSSAARILCQAKESAVLMELPVGCSHRARRRVVAHILLDRVGQPGRRVGDGIVEFCVDGCRHDCRASRDDVRVNFVGFVIEKAGGLLRDVFLFCFFLLSAGLFFLVPYDSCRPETFLWGFILIY